MKMRCNVLHSSIVPGVILCAALLVASAPSITRAARVVGTGTVDSCTDAALDAALANGGVVTFDCGPQPVTIILTSTKTIADTTTVDGGGRITLDGNHAVQVFLVQQRGALNVENLTIANGLAYGVVGNGG